MSKIKFKMSEELNKDNLIVISNKISTARYKLSLPTQKLLLFLISNIKFKERQNGKFIEEHEYDLKVIYDFFKSTGSEKSKDLKGKLKNSFVELKDNELIMNDINSDGEEYLAKYPWYSKIVLDEKNNKFYFRFNNQISDLLLVAKNYYKSHLKEYLRIKSSHAINLYELLRSEEYTNHNKKYSLNDLKKRLDLINNKSYSDWYIFRRDVLNPTILQLNKNTNYIFSFDIQRVGRKVGFVIFQVFEKKNVKELSTYISSKLKDYFSKQDNHIKALFESRELERILYYYDPMEDHLILSLENTPLKEEKDIKALETVLEEIGAIKKVFETIFRKGTTIELKKTYSPWNNLQGEDKIVFDTLTKKYGLSSKQSHTIIMKHDSKEIQTKIRENIVGHQKGFLKKYEFEKNIIKPIENIQGYIYAGLFEMKKSK